MDTRRPHKRLLSLSLAGLRPVYARVFLGITKKGGRQNAFVAAKGDLTGVEPPGRARVLHEVEAPANNRNRLPTFDW